MRFKSLVSFWPIFIISLVCFLLPWLWLREGLPIAYAEPGFFYFIVEPKKVLEFFPYAWWDRFGLGIPPFAIAQANYFLFVQLLGFLGASALWRQYIVFSLILLISGLATYFSAQMIFGYRKNKLALFAGLFYLLNPFVMNQVWHRFSLTIFSLPIMPLTFLIAILITKKPSFFLSFSFALTTLVFSSVLFHPGYFIPLVLPAFLYILFYGRSLKVWGYVGLALVLALVFNLWWLLPFFSTVSDQFSKTMTVVDSVEMLKILSSWSPLLFVFRLLNRALIYWWGVDYRPGIVEFLIPFLALLGLLAKKYLKITHFFGFLLIIGLFLSKGLQPPGGSFFGYLFKRISILHIFRHPQEKFGLILAFSYAFLIPVGIGVVLARLSSKILKYLTLGIIVIFLFGISVWPMWTGDQFSHWANNVPQGLEKVPDTRVKIPDYWYQTAADFNQKEGLSRIVFLPQVWFDYVWYSWPQGYTGGEFESVNLLFDQPSISRYLDNPLAEQFRTKVFKKIFSSPEDYFPALALMNVSHVLIRNDIDVFASRARDLPEVHKKVESSEALEKIKSQGKLDIYKLKDDYFLPRFYIAEKVDVLSEKEEAGFYPSAEEFPPRPAFFSAEKLLNPDTLGIPELTFRRINPTKYELTVSKATKPYVLVFSELFHSSWKLYLKKESNSDPSQDIIKSYFEDKLRERKHKRVFWNKDIFETWQLKAIADKRHWLVNGYANSWHIMPEDVNGKQDYELIIEFQPQRWLYIGIFISAFGLLISLVLLILSRVKQGKK